MSGSSNPLDYWGSDPSNPLAQGGGWTAQHALDVWNAMKSGNQQQWAMYPTDMGYMPPGSARVVPDKTYDVAPILDMGNVNIADPQARQLSVQEQQWWNMLDALKRSGASQDVIDYHMSQNPQVMVSDRWAQEGQQAPQIADVIQRAMAARQRQERK